MNSSPAHTSRRPARPVYRRAANPTMLFLLIMGSFGILLPICWPWTPGAVRRHNRRVSWNYQQAVKRWEDRNR